MTAVFLVSFLINYIYEDSDSLIVIDDSMTICGEHQYTTKIDINSGTLTVRQWDGTDSTGWLFLNAPLIHLHDSSTINGSGSGYRGGTIPHPDGFGPGYGEGGSGNGGGGGGAGYGGLGGAGGDFYPGAGGSTYGSDSDTFIDMGSGGGAGRLSAVDGPGGNGGARVYLRGQRIRVDSSYVYAHGQRGFDGSLEAGGGGSGGGIMVLGDSVLIHHSAFIAEGGDGGDASFGGGGGAGGGRIKVFYSSDIDTSDMHLSVTEGAAGSGAYGTPESGTPGSTYIALIIGIVEQVTTSTPRIQIHANPVRNRVFITLDKVPIVLRLYDIAGRVVKKARLTKKTEYIHLDGLGQGVYFLNVGTESRPLGKIILIR
jgi:hypothetical protein